MLRKAFFFVIFMFGTALAGRLWADAYQQGLQLEKAKDYPAALVQFESVPQDDIFYIKARKEIGTCHYYLGQRAQALEAYDQYLALNPVDDAMRTFVQGLHGSAPVVAAPAPTPTPALVEPFRRRYGLRGSLGYGLALTDGGFGYGRYDDYLGIGCSGCYQPHYGVGEDVQNDQPYHGSPGAGLALGVEVLAAIRPQLELSLGVFPVGLDAKANSTLLSYGNVLQTDSSSTKFQALPIIASLYGKVPLGPTALSLVLGFGLGYAPAGNLTTHSDYTYNPGSGVVATSKNLTKSLGAAVAYRTVLGMDYALNKNFSLMLGVALLAVNFTAGQDVVEESFSNAGTRYKRNTTIQYVDAPPKAGVASDTGMVATSSGWTQTWDDGRSKKTETWTWDPGSGTWTNDIQTTTKAQKGLSSNDLAIQQFSPFLALTWYY